MALATTEPWQPSNHRLPRVEIDLDAMVMDATQGTSTTSRGDTATEPVDFDAIMKELRAVEDYIRWDKIHTELAMRQEYALIRDDAVTSVTLTSDEKGNPTPARDVQSANARRLRPSSAMTKRLKNLDALMKELLEGMQVFSQTTVQSLGEAFVVQTQALYHGAILCRMISYWRNMAMTCFRKDRNGRTLSIQTMSHHPLPTIFVNYYLSSASI